MTNGFVAVEANTGQVAAYDTLASASIPTLDLPLVQIRRLPRYPNIPGARIVPLAVDRAFQGRGLGTAMLADAARRVLSVAPAAFALLVDAKHERAEAFYQHHGFMPLASAPHRGFPLDKISGRGLARSNGARGSVSLTPEMMRLLKDPAAAVRLVHTHQNARSLPKSDLSVLGYPGVACIEVAGHGGSVYGAHGRRPPYILGLTLGNAYKAAMDAAGDVLGQAASAGRLGEHEANALYHHVVASALDAAGLLRYEAILSAEKMRMIDGNRTVFVAALDAATKAALKASKP